MDNRKVRLDKKVSPHLVRSFKLDQNQYYVTKKMHAADLLTADRIDLVAKIAYLGSLDRSLKTDFFKNLYRGTISAFTNGTHKEPGNSNKCSLQVYEDTFASIASDISKNGFDAKRSLVPVTNDGFLLDGAHRVAAAIHYNKPICTVALPIESGSYNLAYFQKSYLDPMYLDYLCLEYAKLKDNIYAICLWPACPPDKQKEALKYLSGKFRIVYEKDINFSYMGLRNFMSQAYYEQPWIGSLEDGYRGVNAKLDLCYKEKNTTKIIVVEEESVEKIIAAKQAIREKIGIGNHSIHSTDDKEETIKMLSMVLNKNSIDFLNQADLYKYKKAFQKITDFKKYLIKNNILSDELVVDGSTILAMYGLRDSDDIDVIASDKTAEKIKSDIDLHNDLEGLYGKKIDDLIYNPSNYFMFDGIKFITAKNLIKMKQARGERKDIYDVKMLSKFNEKASRIVKMQFYIHRKIGQYRLRARTTIAKFCRKLGIYNLVRAAMRKVHL